ncbi:MAG TPA: HAMP domain-containing sensor histidine kinase [Nitrososphaeraceae archaeon]|nr:HAMP domain-containing sensor histidine kinase [Nitrososphaeraceae archaeon]
MTIPSSRSKKTKVLHRTEVINAILDIFSNANHRIDVCGNSNFPLKISSFESVKKVVIAAKNRGIGLRFIIEITKENLQYCKDLMRITDELRHMDEIEANFGLSETEYLGSITLQEEVLQATYSNVKEVVEQQQYIFDTFWRKAIPADQKIREIEEGIEPEVIETIRNPFEIQKIAFELVKSARDEILLVFSTANAFHRQERTGMIKLLKEAAAERRVQIRILTPIDDLIKGTVQKLIREQQQQNQPRIDIRFIGRFSQTKIRILVVDKKSSLVVELKDDTKESSYEAMGLATYSNSKSTVLSYVSIFETLWMQTELYEQLVESNNGLAKAYEQLEAANEQLKVHEKMQKEFINVASHELRTPIQPILGLSEVLHAKIKDTEQRQLLDTITRNAKRLQRLTDDILDVTKIESQSLKLKKERFNLNDVITNVIDEMIINREFKNKNNDDDYDDDDNIKLEYSPKDIFVEADRVRVTQVISNLLNNAVKFTKEGKITIAIEKKDDEEIIVISIKDTGIGIDSEMFPKLFSKFASKSYQGTGLGLFICKSIVEAHGGKIWAENNNNTQEKKGSTFYFTLPTINRRQQDVKVVDQ